MTTLIVGGGLSGLYAAWRLHRAGRDVLVLEARNRAGGRVLSEPASAGVGRFDLGPTWFWPEFQPKMPALLSDLGIASFPQWTDGHMVFEPLDGTVQTIPSQLTGPAALRISGGAAALIDALAAALPEGKLLLGSAVQEIHADGSRMSVKTTGQTYEGHSIVLALPPRLLMETISITPPLPQNLEVLCGATPTWMAAHAKIVVVYEQAFWRDSGLSGQAFSYRGPMMEIHDASPASGGPYALFGFIGIPAQNRRGIADDIIELALAQLERLFGAPARKPMDVLYKDWSEDPMTAAPADLTETAGHPEYGVPTDACANWPGPLALVGSESASRHGGYLEGCLEAVDQWLHQQPGL